MGDNIINKRCNEKDQSPKSNQLDYGEIGVNYNKESPALYIKTDDGIVHKLPFNQNSDINFKVEVREDEGEFRVEYEDGTFIFYNIKGSNGTAVFKKCTATVDDKVGTPSVESELITNNDGTYSLKFDFHNLKGKDGTNGNDPTSTEIDVKCDTTDIIGDGNAEVTATTQVVGNKTFITFKFSNLKKNEETKTDSECVLLATVLMNRLNEDMNSWRIVENLSWFHPSIKVHKFYNKNYIHQIELSDCYILSAQATMSDINNTGFWTNGDDTKLIRSSPIGMTSTIMNNMVYLRGLRIGNEDNDTVFFDCLGARPQGLIIYRYMVNIYGKIN